METDEVTALVGYRSNSFIDFQSTLSKPVMDFALKITVKLFTQKQFIDQRRLPSSMRAIIATTIMMMMIMVMIMINHDNHINNHCRYY